MQRHREWAQMAILHWERHMCRGKQEQSSCTHALESRLQGRKGRYSNQFSMPVKPGGQKNNTCP